MTENIIKKINGVGEVFRYITPALIAIIGSLIITGQNGIRKDIDSLKTHFVNHLMHHQDLEVGYERRITQNEKKTLENEKDIARLEQCVEKLRTK